MFWPDPPQCCKHGPNSHGRERCQVAGCGCDRDLYLTQRQMILQQRAQTPPIPDRPIDWRWQLTARLDGSLEVEINKAVFGDDDEATDRALAEVQATARELGDAKPAEVDE